MKKEEKLDIAKINGPIFLITKTGRIYERKIKSLSEENITFRFDEKYENQLAELDSQEAKSVRRGYNTYENMRYALTKEEAIVARRECVLNSLNEIKKDMQTKLDKIIQLRSDNFDLLNKSDIDSLIHELKKKGDWS